MELVTLLAEDGTAIGTAPKDTVHSEATPLHLAFSCYVFDREGHLLLTRRALSKRTWPGVWTNSFCGHPRPDEDMIEAVVRRGTEEIGARPLDVVSVLPAFRYRAIDAGGTVEHEICPVHVARVDDAIAPDSAEVMEWAWVRPDDLRIAVSSTPFAFSPWLREQLPLLHEAGRI
ncbi:isopentenyl-diphosphate Delta-isomerase [Microbacterium sp. NPDC056234]|uniref:isopentenyl-diphosphate Delta-isomerase n=1 Tax=Microbacterium sp. NPDC056234 TaxID=3345757 RepID=UPI0035D86122